MENVVLKSEYDSLNIYTNLYDVENPKGVVQIVHGMKEHQERYSDFANFLNQNGYAVMTSDLRGHGKNASLLGYMEGKKSHEALVADQVTITNYLNKRYPNLDVILFGHSMGTIISRNLLMSHADAFKKVVLTGVPAYQAACYFGIFFANVIGKFKSDTYVSKMLEKLTLSPFSKAVKNAKTDVDWVSVSQTNINNYLNDPYCNIPFTISAYKALYNLVKNMHKAKKYQVNDPNLPILMLIGELDPCPLGKKGFNSSINTLKKAGYINLSSKIYPNMRHEILNEDNHMIVYEDILNYLNS